VIVVKIYTVYIVQGIGREMGSQCIEHVDTPKNYNAIELKQGVI
jgi:hypothetical protein